MQNRKKNGALDTIAVWGSIVLGSASLMVIYSVFLFGGCPARADSIATLRWDIETSRPGAYMIDVFRGETVRLEPRYVSYGAALGLVDVYDVVLRYRSTDMAEGYYYAVTGAVHAVDSGRVSITWTPGAEAPAAAYEYTIAAKSLDGDTLRAFGGLRLRGSVTGVPTNQPTAITTFDWSSVEHLNAHEAPFLTDYEMAALQAAVSTLETGKVSVVDFHSTNALVWAAIADAQGMASMGGDVSGPSTNATVVAIRGVGVAEIAAGAETDTYVLAYDHATGTFALVPAGGGGLFEGHILRLHDTAQVSEVLLGEVGMYRTIRPGNLPSAVINVAGTEIAWFDLLGMTMRQGSIHLLSDELAVNVAAYDGSAAAPAYTWAGGKTLGKYRFSYNGDYAEGFAVGGQRVWYWGNDGIHLDEGMQIFGLESKYDTSNPSNFLNQAAADDLYLARSSTHEAWTDAGGTYTATGVVATSTLLTNGIAAWEWTVDGPMIPVAEMSADGNTWMEAAATNAAQYFRVRLTSPDGFPGDLDTMITNIAAMSWTRPDLVDNEHDTVGQVLLVDTPVVNRQAATKKYVDDTVGGVNPANWSEYPATSIVRTDGYPVFLGGGWQIYDTEAEGMSYISKMDAWVDDGDLVIAGNGTPAITVETGLRGLHIDYFSLINASNAVVHVSTNNVDAAPMIQHTHSLLQPDWQMVELTSTTYPTPSNDVYVLTFAVPNYTESTHFFRAVQLSGEGQVRVHTPIVAEGGLTMEGVHRATWPDTTMLASLPHNAGTNAPTLYTPAHVGHQLIRSGGSNEVWQAFGTTTNDWLRVFP